MYRMKISILFTVLTFLECVASAQISTCGVQNSQTCVTQSVRIVQVPQGLVDGHNRMFTLARTPTDSHTVRVTNNGTTEPAQAYTVTGQTLTFSESTVPKQGDVLRVEYLADPSLTPRSMNVPTPTPDTGTIRRDALVRALSLDVAANNKPSTAPSTQVPISPNRMSSRALDALARRLSESPAIVKPGALDNDADSLVGVEGLGDQTSGSQFATLLQTPRSQSARTTKKASEANSVAPRREFRSIQMLSRQLNESTGTSSPSKRSAQ